MSLTEKLATLLLTVTLGAVFVSLPGCPAEETTKDAPATDKKDEKAEDKKADDNTSANTTTDDKSTASTETKKDEKKDEKPTGGPKGAGSTNKPKDPFAGVDDF